MYLNLSAILIANSMRLPLTLLASYLTAYVQKPHYGKLWIQYAYSETTVVWESLLALLDYTNQIGIGKKKNISEEIF
jgi:hypothetical protein